MLYLKREKKSDNKTINLGLEFVRPFLSFWVLVGHCSKIQRRHAKYIYRAFHVPTFTLIAFYFFHKVLTESSLSKIVFRFQRITIPYILWPLTIFIFNNLFFALFSFGQYEAKLSIKDLYIQILIGARFFRIFWFQFNLIFTSLFFSIISFLFKNKLLRILQFLGLFSLFLHITKINYYYLTPYNCYDGSFKLNLGTFVEMMPISVIGCIFNSFDILNKLRSFSIYNQIILLLILLNLFEYDIFLRLPGFRYPNVFLNILASIIIFILFGSLHFEEIQNKKIILIIRSFTKFTGGIYYTHQIFRDYLTKYSQFFSRRTYSISLIIYIICYFFCYIGNSIFKNNKLRYLFN